MTNEEIARLQDEAHRGFQCGQNLFVDLVENLRVACEALEKIVDVPLNPDDWDAIPSNANKLVCGVFAREALAKIRGENSPPDGNSQTSS